MGCAMLDRWKQGVLGSTLTSIQLGGPIDYVSTPTNADELRADCIEAKKAGLAVRIIGAGSNLVFDEKGFRGLVIRPQFMQQQVLDTAPTEPVASGKNERYATGDGGEGYLKLSDTTEGTGQYGEMLLGAGVVWGAAVMDTLNAGFLGLHTFAHIPCRVGGAIANNIHGGPNLLSEYIVSVDALAQDTGEIRTFQNSELKFGYDESLFLEDRNWVSVSAVFRFEKGSAEQIAAAKAQYLSWVANKKEVQPSLPNCGSVFQNVPVGVETGEKTRSAGYYLEQVGARGMQLGQLQVAPSHANFITNLGGASADDFIQMVSDLRDCVYARFGFYLQPEVEIVSEFGESKKWQ
jgi:UDP-N-acetylmuramate dehydrogenase